MTGDSCQSAREAGLPPMAVPMTVKLPDPMTAPMPRAVSETGPRVLRSAVSGDSESEMSLSIDLVAKICRGWLGGGRGGSSAAIYGIVTIVSGDGPQTKGADACNEMRAELIALPAGMLG